MDGSFFFDTYALVAILQQRPEYEPYRDVPITCERYNLYELAAYLLRDDASLARARRDIGSLHARLLTPAREQLLSAASLRLAEPARRLSYVDALGYVLARESGLPFLTGDRGFSGLPVVEFVPVA